MGTILDQYGREVEGRSMGSYKNPTEWMIDWLNDGSPSTAGERINPKIALTVMAFFACVRNISEDMAKLPMKIRQKRGRVHEDLPDHPVSVLLRRPSSYMNRHQFWKTFMSHRCSYQGAYAWIARNQQGQPEELLLLDPDSVTVWKVDGHPVYHVMGMQEGHALLERDMLRMNMLTHCGYDGYRITSIARQVLGAAVALQKYRGSFFGNGANPSGILTHPATLSTEVAERLRKQFQARYTGGANAHQVLALEEGMNWVQTSTNAKDAEAVDLTNITIEDICRIFRMPPHKIGHLVRSTNNNIEHQGLEYDRDTLDPIADELRAEIEFKLLSTNEIKQNLYPHINLNALMRADVGTRTTHFREMYYMGVYSANDIREMEDESMVPDGDRRFVQRNLIPADRIDDVLDKETAPEPTGGGNLESVADGFRAMLQEKIGDILFVEADKVNRAKDTTKFFNEHRRRTAETMLGYIAGAARGLGINCNAGLMATEYADHHCAMSNIDRQEGTYPNPERPRLNAEWLMEAIQNADAI